MSKNFYYGGQALMEGVMMRGKTNIAMAVRRPNKEIDLDVRELPGIYSGKIRKMPFIRGILVLIESLILGTQALLYSANVALEEEEEEISGPLLWVVLFLAIAFAIALFFVTPLLIVERVIAPHFESEVVVRTIEGILRIAIFLAYLGFMNMIPTIRRVFAYHGAEHKTINAYEDGAPLEVESVRGYSTAHLRCGTSFLLTVLVIAIVLFVAIGDLGNIWLLIASRVALVPVIAGLAYEITRFSANYADNPALRIFFVPGLLLQTLTTRQPDDEQLETGIRALEAAIEFDAEHEEPA